MRIAMDTGGKLEEAGKAAFHVTFFNYSSSKQSLKVLPVMCVFPFSIN